jgi:hypothetical protein
LAEDGSGKASIDITHKGEFSQLIKNYVTDADDEHKRRYLINTVGFKQPDELQISQKGANADNSVLHLDMQFEKLPDFTAGSKHFMNARIYKFWNKALPKNENRQSDYYLDFPLIQSDTTVYQLPEGFAPENLPKAASLKFNGGQFKSDYIFDTAKRQITTSCSIQLNNHVIPVKDFHEAAKFFSDILNEQQQKIIVKKQ